METQYLVSFELIQNLQFEANQGGMETGNGGSPLFLIHSFEANQGGMETTLVVSLLCIRPVV